MSAWGKELQLLADLSPSRRHDSNRSNSGCRLSNSIWSGGDWTVESELLQVVPSVSGGNGRYFAAKPFNTFIYLLRPGMAEAQAYEIPVSVAG